MSALLDDIIQLAEDDKQSLPNLLRKCLRLGHELKNDRLKAWATQELNGYDCEKEQLPEYRTMLGQAYGYFVGQFQQAPNHIIPPAVLEKEDHEWASKIYLAAAVSTYADLAKGSTSGILKFPWPANMVAFYQEKLWQGFILHSAWQQIPTNAIVGMLDVIRNLTMKMALEIKDELGTSYTDLHQIKSSDAEKIQSIVINALGNANVAMGHANLDASGQTTIIAGDRKTLNTALTKVGLDKEDLNELTEAIQVDGNKAGSKVTKWIGDKAEKLLVGGVKVGASIAQQVLTEMLMQHYGLKKP